MNDNVLLFCEETIFCLDTSESKMYVGTKKIPSYINIINKIKIFLLFKFNDADITLKILLKWI